MNRRKFLLASGAGVMCGVSSTAFRSVKLSEKVSSIVLRDKLAQDPLRPQYHLLPQAGRVGDPCAPRFFNGKYHVFFHGDFGGPGWHHAISSDLIHWEHLPIALAPTPDSYDSYGCFTGSVLPGTNVPSIVYAGVTRSTRRLETIRAEDLREVQCVASSTDPELRTWRKLGKPVIEAPPTNLKVVGFRDPFSWKDENIFYMGVGSGFPQIGGAVLLYRSKDARHWEYMHPLAQGMWNGRAFTNPVGSGEMWECPDFFPLGDKHVLIYSSEYITFWEVGTYDRRELRFHSERKGFLDYGAYYAPKTMEDHKGRRILWGWVQETRSKEAIQAAGWSGSISLPRVLTLGSNNELKIEVPGEFGSLRDNTATVKNPRDRKDLDAGLSRAVIRKRAGEIICNFRANRLDCGLELLLGPPANGITLFKISSGVSIGNIPSIIVGDQTLALSPDNLGHSTLHIWIDGSIIELFIDAKRVITTRCYETGDGLSDIHVNWTGAVDSLIRLSVSDIKPISDDRLTT